jgi:outer membrane protein assembly factor BamD (BamD/ComL family)
VITKRFEPTVDAREEGATAEPNGSNAGRGNRDTAAQMLSAARGLRAQGRLGEAAQAYRALQSAHPRSAEARASQVSLGDLDLSLGNPSSALRSFEAYLAGGGALAQEARYGRIRALQALGRKAQERAATEEFLRLYPDSVQARALRARSAR